MFAIGCFAVVAENVSSRRPITKFDQQQAERFYEYSTTHPDVWDFAIWITDLGSGRPRTIVIVGVALFLLLEGRCRLALFWGATQYLLKEIVAVSKDMFECPRPHFDTASYIVGGWSFPSGHSAGVMATYGMIAFLVAMRWPDRWFRWPVIAGLGSIILMVGLSRMLLGVHFFTDVVGGFLLGLGYVSLCVAGVELGRRVYVSRTPG